MTLNEIRDFFSYLKAVNLIKNQTELAQKIGYSRQYVNEVINNNNPLTDDFVNSVKARFQNEILEWQNMVSNHRIEDTTYTKDMQIKELKERIAELKSALLDKNKIIDGLEKEVAELKRKSHTTTTNPRSVS